MYGTIDVLLAHQQSDAACTATGSALQGLHRHAAHAGRSGARLGPVHPRNCREVRQSEKKKKKKGCSQSVTEANYVEA